MSDNINEVLGRIDNAVTALRETDIANLKSRDVLLEEKLNTINADIDEMKSNVAEMEKKSGRPAITTEDANREEYKAAWEDWARKGTGSDTIEAKAITLNETDGQGNTAPGVLAPRTVEAGIYQRLETLSPIRAEASVIQISGDDYRFLRSDGDFETGWVGETQPRPETATNTLGEVRTPIGEIYANPHASQRALDDTTFDLASYMTEQTARAFAKAENAAFVNGDGVNKPQGILATAGLKTVKTGDAANMPANADAYIQMIYALRAEDRQGAKFIMGSASQVSIRLLKNSQGDFVWQNSLVAGQPDTIGGYGVIVAEEMPATAANAVPVLFGNLAKGYLIVDRIGIRTLRDPYSKKPYVGFYSTKRVGGIVRDIDAFVGLKVAK